MHATAQLQLFDEHALYHQPDRFGFFSVLAKDRAGVMRQQSYILPKLAQVLQLLPRDRDSYLSQAEFIAPNRRIVNLARIGLLFVDLDCYKLGIAPDAACWHLLQECDERSIPHPSIIIHSGRGVYAKWLLDGTIPRQALPRWNRLQATLVNAFQGVGADPAAKDASRVLRIVGTVNTKSGEIVRVIHVTQGLDGEPVRYGFEQLAETLLPAARWDIEAERRARAERRQFKLLQGGKAGGQTGNLRPFSGRQLAWHRLEDLRTLAELRGGVAPGWRMLWMFWSLNFLLLSGATHSGQMYHEARALAREIGFLEGWNEGDLSTLYRKAQAHERGERIEHAGREYPPLYTPRNQTLIDVFRVTPDEERQLRTIVSAGEARERHRKRDEARRRAAGSVERAAYEANAASRQKPWEALGMSRASWYRAGKPMPTGEKCETSPCVLLVAEPVAGLG
jgi:hypothetical protein